METVWTECKETEYLKCFAFTPKEGNTIQEDLNVNGNISLIPEHRDCAFNIQLLTKKRNKAIRPTGL
jgi:hypothetical protein